MSETMSDQSESNTSGTATLAPPKPRPAPPKLDRLPQWRVLLHNDDVNVVEYVVLTLCELTTLSEQDAITRTVEAHRSGISLVVSTHREHAELLQEQFTSKHLTVTIEPEQG